MPEFHAVQNNGPIFVVGSPRSGTSILTWCLGQHTNIFVQEESDWLGEFAVSVGVQYRVGHKRGERSQLGALGIGQSEFFKSIGDGINEMILRHGPARDESKTFNDGGKFSPSMHPLGDKFRPHERLKGRWVDGTPEYSLHICGLKKLFPKAKFIHIVRDVKSVVDSLLNFKPDGNDYLVKTEREAYEYWIRTVQACMQAEAVLDKESIFRLQYSDLVNQPAKAMGQLLEFLDGPYISACIEPLSRRINSSNVPADFCAKNSNTNNDVVEYANQLYRKVQRPLNFDQRLPHLSADFKGAFEKRVAFMAELDASHGALQKSMLQAQAIIKNLSGALNYCGIILAASTLVGSSIILYKLELIKNINIEIQVVCLMLSVLGVAVYFYARKKGLMIIAKKIIRKFEKR